MNYLHVVFSLPFCSSCKSISVIFLFLSRNSAIINNYAHFFESYKFLNYHKERALNSQVLNFIRYQTSRFIIIDYYSLLAHWRVFPHISVSQCNPVHLFVDFTNQDHYSIRYSDSSTSYLHVFCMSSIFSTFCQII